MKKILGLLVLLSLGNISFCQSPCETGTYTMNHSKISVKGASEVQNISSSFISFESNSASSPSGIRFGSFQTYTRTSWDIINRKYTHKQAEFKFSHPNIRNDQIQSVSVTIKLMRHANEDEFGDNPVITSGNGNYGLTVRKSSCGNQTWPGNIYDCLSNGSSSLTSFVGQKNITTN